SGEGLTGKAQIISVYLNIQIMPRTTKSFPEAREDDQWRRAALEGRTEIIRALLEKGTDVNEKDDCGRTALMFAAINLHRDTVRTLLESGADVNVTANDGATALMLAACAGDIDIVRALLARSADVCGKFISTSKTAAMLAAEKGFDEIAQLFKGTEDRAKLLAGRYGKKMNRPRLEVLEEAPYNRDTFSPAPDEETHGISPRVRVSFTLTGVQRADKIDSQ
ncbi:MAG: ankyrin repeat domain-containing protein, partial [Acidobacteria bacterium]|nr:ankyrin repeat domain-containing protein [Acidobacteriota bacterium]